MDWLFVQSTAPAGAAHFTKVRNYDNAFELKKCMSLLAKWPTNAELRMDPDVPDDIELVDSLYGPSNTLFVSDRVCRLFESIDVRRLEFLPINVIDHKKRPSADRYFAVNILDQCDCIDTKRSKVEWNDIDPQMISVVDKLVIDPKRIPSDIRLFRPKLMPFAMLIHRSASDRIQADGLRGFAFTEVADYAYP
jgi:hypothetical protein